MKKIVTLLLVGLLAVAFTACGSREGGDTDPRSIEVLYKGWNNIPVEDNHENNPYKKYVDETYDVNYKLSLTSDMQTELSKRFSSTKAKKPDVIMFDWQDFTSLKTLYNQGFFVEDYTPYMEKVPAFQRVLDESSAAKNKVSENGKLICLLTPADQPVEMNKIRRDWVEKYSPTGENPQTMEQLLEMAENVKKDSGGKKYLFTSAGEGKTFGGLNSFQYMFGDQEDWYVTESGEVSHPILDGTRKKFLDFVKTLVTKEYIYPDWYIQSWGNKKGSLYGGNVGIDRYPPSLVNDMMFTNGDDATTVRGIWDNLRTPTDTAGLTRKAEVKKTYKNFIVISKEAAKSEEKMSKILRLLNDMLYPAAEADREDSLYMKLRWGVGIDNYEIGAGKEMEPVLDSDGKDTGFLTYYYQKNKDNHSRPKYGSSWDYGVLMATTDDKVIEYLGAGQYGSEALDYVYLYNDALAYFNASDNFNYAEMLNLNARLENTLDKYVNTYEIEYVRGTTTQSYEAFVSGWLAAGATTMMESVKQQFKAAGYIS